MSSGTTPQSSQQPPVGTFAPAPPNSSRSPCPVVNALCNHGFLSRSGRNIYASDLQASLKHVGISYLLAKSLSNSPYLEYTNPAKALPQKPLSFFAKVWRILTSPLAYFFGFMGCWQGTFDKRGRKVMDLEGLGVHGAIEHDVSLSRRDIAQKEGQIAPQQDLIDKLLACSSDGGKTISVDDLGGYIKDRIQQQLLDNPNLIYNTYAHDSNSFNLTMVLRAFGDGERVPCSYVRAIFKEERLPWNEGWKKRTWWPLGLIETFRQKSKFEDRIGVKVSVTHGDGHS